MHCSGGKMIDPQPKLARICGKPGKWVNALLSNARHQTPSVPALAGHGVLCGEDQ